MASFVHLLDQRRLIGAGGSTVAGDIYFYYTGTTDLAPVYLDTGMTVPSDNPISVAAGEIIPLLFLDGDVVYRRRIVYDDGTIDDQDPLGRIFSEEEVGIPVGTILDYAGPSIPDGFLLCSGAAISRTTYSDLFDAIGTTYGAGNGTTTFNLPDFRGRVLAGKDNMGGNAASRLTEQISGSSLGATGGVEEHVLASSEMPSHKHTLTDPGHTHTYQKLEATGGADADSGTGSQNASATTDSHTTGITMANTGGGLAHTNLQPTVIVNKIIKAEAVTFLSLIGMAIDFSSKAEAEAIGIAPADDDMGEYDFDVLTADNSVKGNLQELGEGYKRMSFKTLGDMTSSEIPAAGEGSIWKAAQFFFREADPSATDQDFTTAGGVKLYVIDTQLTDVSLYGVASDGVTDDTAAWQSAFDSGKPLFWSGGTSLVYDNIYIPGNAFLLGAGTLQCVMQKMYFEGGSTAMLQPTGLNSIDEGSPGSNPGSGCDNVYLGNFTVTCEPSVYDNGSQVSGKLITTGRNSGWLIENIVVDYWHGFGITLTGHGNTVRDIHFQNPDPSTVLASGCDGVHIAGCYDENFPHIVQNITGTTGDDIVGIFPSTSGPSKNANILGVIINNVRGESLYARVIGCGHSAAGAAATSRVANIYARGVFGKGGIVVTNEATATAIVENVDIEAVLDGAGSTAYVSVLGVVVGQAYSRMHNIRIKASSMNNTSSPSTRGIRLEGQIDNLTLEPYLDCSGTTGYSITQRANSTIRNLQIPQGWIKAGSDAGFKQEHASTSILSGGRVNCTIENIAGGTRGVSLETTTGVVFNVVCREKSGESGTVGIYEGSNCSKNVFTGDVSGVDTPVHTAQTTSTYRDLLGYVTQNYGSDTVANGTATKAVTHGLGYTPSKAHIVIQWDDAFTDQGGYAISAVSSTTFTVKTPANVGGNRLFYWSVDRIRN